MREINEAGLNLIKHFEGCRWTAYRDTGGILTIGYGHTRNVQEGQTINEDQATRFLIEDVGSACRSIEQLLGSMRLNDNQFAALVSLTFNCGSAPLTHTLGNKLRASDYAGAADEFLKWNHVNGKVVEGLTDRRTAERNLFLKSGDGS